MSERVPPLTEPVVSIEATSNQGIIRRNAGNIALYLALSGGALVGGTLGARSFGAIEGKVCATTVEVRHTPLTLDTDSPPVEAQLMPAFSVDFPDAHSNPLFKTDVAVTDLDSSEIEQIRQELDSGTETDLKKLEQNCRDDAESLIEKSIVEASIWGGVGAVVGSLAMYGIINLARPIEMRRKARILLVAGSVLLPIIPAAGSAVWAKQTINKEALRNPEYKGYMKEIEDIVAASKISLKDYQKKSGELTKWTEQIAQLRDQLTKDTTEDDYLKILAISDIHSRPCGYQRVDLLNKAYDIDFDLDKGDVVEWSENELGLLLPKNGCGGIRGPQDLSVPVFQVKGNHDPNKFMAQLDRLKNVTVLDGEVVNVPYTASGKQKTITLLGIADHRYEADDVLKGSDEPKNDLIKLLSEDELDAIKADNYDILVHHDPALFAELDEANLLPDDLTLLTAGHTHKAKVDTETFSSPLEITGSSGGGGLRTYQNEGQPSAYSVIYVDPDTKEVVRIEQISVTNDGIVTIRNIDVDTEDN